MDAVREFILRLVEITPERGKLAARHRRIVLPGAAQFALDGTILRTEPIGMMKRPGTTVEMSQLLEWLDVSSDGADPRENDLGVDLAAILALACGRKVAFANEVPMKYANAEWTWFLEAGHAFDNELYGPVEGDIRTRFVNIVQALVALPEKQALSFGGAVRMRNAACCLVEADFSSAYGLLIAAIETLSEAFGDKRTSWEHWDKHAQWDAFIGQLSLNDEHAAELRKRLLADRHIRLRLTFAEYAASNLSESFWQERYFRYTPQYAVDADDARPNGGSWREEGSISTLVPADRDELRKRLKLSYDARSQVFHQSTRLDQISVMPFPSAVTQLLPFRGLRRILDHLLWREISKGATGAPELPDVKLFHPDTEPGGAEGRPLN